MSGKLFKLQAMSAMQEAHTAGLEGVLNAYP